MEKILSEKIMKLHPLYGKEYADDMARQIIKDIPGKLKKNLKEFSRDKKLSNIKFRGLTINDIAEFRYAGHNRDHYILNAFIQVIKYKDIKEEEEYQIKVLYNTPYFD